ncbi:MAG: hypothetical protein K1X55_01880 [Chitinophagales bacterium]|nr:hypothetical protein [Chitinophagales bacterium]
MIRKGLAIISLCFVTLSVLSQELSPNIDVKAKFIEKMDERYGTNEEKYIYDFQSIGDKNDSAKFGINYIKYNYAIGNFFKKRSFVNYYSLNKIEIVDDKIVYEFLHFYTEKFSPRYFYSRNGIILNWYYFEYKYQDGKWNFVRSYTEGI